MTEDEMIDQMTDRAQRTWRKKSGIPTTWLCFVLSQYEASDKLPRGKSFDPFRSPDEDRALRLKGEYIRRHLKHGTDQISHFQVNRYSNPSHLNTHSDGLS